MEKEWLKYREETEFNLSILPKSIKQKGILVVFEPKQFIITRGEFPEYLFFIQSGKALGTRDYADGNEYNYFQIDKNNGNVGLLEVLAQKEQYIATIMCLTKVEALKIQSSIVYSFIMMDIGMLRRCITLVAQDLYMRSGNDGILYYLNGLNRVRHYFVNYYEMHKNERNKVIVQSEYQDIAKRIGVSVRTVGRSIKYLKENNEILSCNKKVILTKEYIDRLVENLWQNM